MLRSHAARGVARGMRSQQDAHVGKGQEGPPHWREQEALERREGEVAERRLAHTGVVWSGITQKEAGGILITPTQPRWAPRDAW